MTETRIERIKPIEIKPELSILSDMKSSLEEIKLNLNSTFLQILNAQVKLADILTNLNNQLTQVDSSSVALNTSVTRLVNLLNNLKIPIENPESVTAQQKLVPVAGIAVQLPPVRIPYDCGVSILALSTNTGTIYIGNSKLNAEDHTISFPLLASESIEYKIKDLSVLWVDASVSGEGIIWTAEQNG